MENKCVKKNEQIKELQDSIHWTVSKQKKKHKIRYSIVEGWDYLQY